MSALLLMCVSCFLTLFDKFFRLLCTGSIVKAGPRTEYCYYQTNKINKKLSVLFKSFLELRRGSVGGVDKFFRAMPLSVHINLT